MARKIDGQIVFTPKQRKFFELIALGHNLNEAAKMAGYKQPRIAVSDNLQKHTLAFRQAFAQCGYTICDIVQDLLEGKKATRVISAVNTDKEASGATCDFIEVPDWNARHKFMDSIIKLQGFYPNEKHEVKAEVTITNWSDLAKRCIT